MDKTGVGLAIRKYTHPTQTTSAHGFRCAASRAPGLDAAHWIVAQDALAAALARDAEWSPHSAVVLRRWTSEAGTSRVPGYRVVTGYQHLLACPVVALAASNPVELGALSARSGAVLVALVDLPFATSSPALAPGTHLVAWRRADAATAGGKQAGSAALDPAGLEGLPGFRADADAFLFLDLGGTPRAAVPAAPLAFSREKPGRAELASDPASGDSVSFVLCVPSARTASKGFFVELTLQAPAGTFGSGWE
jgi:hypothetical protein